MKKAGNFATDINNTFGADFGVFNGKQFGKMGGFSISLAVGNECL